MSAYVGEYGHLFLKYAIAAGLLNVIEKTAVLLPSVGVRKALTDFAAVYRHLNYADAFKGIQRSVLDNVRDTLCAYELISILTVVLPIWKFCFTSATKLLIANVCASLSTCKLRPSARPKASKGLTI